MEDIKVFNDNTNKELKNDVITFDLDRMKNSMSSPSILVPQGLSREEKRKFILDNSK